MGRKESYKACFLCEDDGKSIINHDTKDCPIYKIANQKVDKLRNLKACTRCSYKNHSTKDCRSKFSLKCRYCGVNHFTCLCVSVGKNAKDSEENGLIEKSSHTIEFLEAKPTDSDNKPKTFTTKGIALVEALRNHTDGQIILPTFTYVLEVT